MNKKKTLKVNGNQRVRIIKEKILQDEIYHQFTQNTSKQTIKYLKKQ